MDAPHTATFDLKAVEKRDEKETRAHPRWHRDWPDCTARLLRTEFALEHAPQYPVSVEDARTIDTIIGNVRGGYGGDIVCAEPGSLVDTAPFLSRYLREFSVPNNPERWGMGGYDYLMERILARVCQKEFDLSDKRLDWDVWRAALAYESFMSKTKWYGSTVHNWLDDADDLLILYFSRVGENILRDPERLDWWIDQFTTGMSDRSRPPIHRWFFLYLIAFADTSTRVPEPPRTDSNGTIDPEAIVAPNPWRLYFEVGDSIPDQFKMFPDAVAALAASQGLGFEVWGVKPELTPMTRSWAVRFSYSKWGSLQKTVVDQESWSSTHNEYEVSYSRSVGQRAPYATADFPRYECTDGLFFNTFNNVLYVWPKREMNSGVVRLALAAGLIAQEKYDQLVKIGFTRLATTLGGK